MTEAEWLICRAPLAMLDYLDSLQGKPSERKLRLFACACVRRLGNLLVGTRTWAALEAAEAFSEGKVSARDMEVTWSGGVLFAEENPAKEAAWAADAAGYIDAASAAVEAAASAANAVRHATGGNEGPAQCRLLRDIFGNPFRPVGVEPAWLAWGRGVIVSLARAIYEERSFERLPILADALEDAGCTSATILGHCRQGGEHVRGCWLVDALLGAG
jgi:hypothetical protein